MITGGAPASELDAKKGLRAKDYLIDFEWEAENLLKQWIEGYQLQGLFHMRGSQVRDLKTMIEAKLREAFVHGQKAQRELSMELRDALHEPSAARQILPPKEVSGRKMTEFRVGQRVVAKCTITESGNSTPDPDAEYPEENYIHARKGDFGEVEHAESDRACVRFERTGTACLVDSMEVAVMEDVSSIDV